MFLEVVILTRAGAGDCIGVPGKKRFQKIFIDFSCQAVVHQFPVVGHIENKTNVFAPAIDAGTNGHQMVTADYRIGLEFFHRANV